MVFSILPKLINLPVFALVFFLFACNPAKPVVPGFETTRWEQGRNGCEPTRIEMVPLITNNKSLLLAQPESGIISVLGKPDLIELYKRNQKMFLYFLSPSQRCGDSLAIPEVLTIRFNAMGRAKEIYSSELKTSQP
ncbi:MAG: hypothetical protein FJZ78_02650 [Bacteroidetes bacterium]|nr:hypothetical protein [Bacteroidota bacterium]